jgi:hypothetical protein
MMRTAFCFPGFWDSFDRGAPREILRGASFVPVEAGAEDNPNYQNGGLISLIKDNHTGGTPIITSAPEHEKPGRPYGKYLFQIFNMAVMLAMMATPAYAATDMWAKAKEIMNSVYTQILGISTIAGVVTASVALLLMNFSKNGRTVDESRAWLKRIIVTWCIINGLGFIMAYVAPFFQGGQYTP